MQVMNTCTGPMTIAGAYTIAPQSIRSFDDALWAELRKRPSVEFWLKRGDLKEITAAAPSPAPVAEPTPPAATEEAAPKARKARA